MGIWRPRSRPYRWYCRSAAEYVLCSGKVVPSSELLYVTHGPLQIATLPAEYGLYSSFVGVLVYCVSVFLPSLSSMSYSIRVIVLRDFEGCVDRSRGRYVSHGLADHQTCQRSTSWGMGSPSNSNDRRLYLRLHRPGNWPSSVGMDCRVHSCTGSQRFHDWICHQHCIRSGSRFTGTEGLRVSGQSILARSPLKLTLWPAHAPQRIK